MLNKRLALLLSEKEVIISATQQSIELLNNQEVIKNLKKTAKNFQKKAKLERPGFGIILPEGTRGKKLRNIISDIVEEKKKRKDLVYNNGYTK